MNCGVCACLYLELLHRRHVVAEHAIFQHGNGVTLSAHFLDLVTSAVAAGSYIRVGVNVTYVSEGADCLFLLPSLKQHTDLWRREIIQMTHLTPGSLMLCPW